MQSDRGGSSIPNADQASSIGIGGGGGADETAPPMAGCSGFSMGFADAPPVMSWPYCGAGAGDGAPLKSLGAAPPRALCPHAPQKWVEGGPERIMLNSFPHAGQPASAAASIPTASGSHASCSSASGSSAAAGFSGA